jgi:aminopeptidase N
MMNGKKISKICCNVAENKQTKMKKLLLLTGFFAMGVGFVFAQDGAEEPAKDTTWKKVFRESYKKINAVVHTKLDVKFDFAKAYMYGKEWLTLQPYFYATDSVLLDAKGMEFKEVALMNGTSKTPVKYTYNGEQINIKLNRSYTRNEKYILYFDYISKPNEVKVKGSEAITDAKGLYFINPRGEEKDKPTQIWTQGETEANSVWMVTIDKPNQKSTQEIAMTVPNKYVTLSNGLLTSKKANADGTRTDNWKMDLPHAPYLFFMGVGEFAVVKDKPYKGKEVSYYVEKDQEKYALKVFGNTPEMMQFFSDKLGVDFPWAKYAQLVGRDYVSGAMENTTATIHQESAYQNNRELTEGNSWEGTIAHELFHQWFGDLVTAESWSNLTVNESFANYSEYLWEEYKNGLDAAYHHNYTDMQGYVMSQSDKKDLVRYYYEDKEQMFDAVSYNKGGRILNMLRNYLGDDAFFKGLNNYLTTNKFKTGEAAQLRLAFEETTGQDLNWFWNQWYYGSGHPKLKIDYAYDDAAGKATVTIEQTQKSGKVFMLPLNVDLYNNGVATRKQIWVTNKIDSFTFNYSKRPELINVDADKLLLAEKTDNKTEDNFIAQYKYAKNYQDRREAIDFFAKKASPELAKGLTDKYWALKNLTIQKLGTSPYKADKEVLNQIEALAKAANTNKKVKAAAINYLVKNGDSKYLPIYESGVKDSSYSVAGAALKGLTALDDAKGLAAAKANMNDAKGALGGAVGDILIKQGTEGDFDAVTKIFDNAPLNQEKLTLVGKYADFLTKVNNIAKIKSGIDAIMRFRNIIPESFRSQVDPMFKSAFDKVTKIKGAEIENYVQSVFK